MSPRNSAEARAPNYDPAYHTLRFEMLWMLSSINRNSNELCPSCEKTVAHTVRDGYTRLLTRSDPNPLQPDSPGSRIPRAFVNPRNGLIDMRSTAQPPDAPPQHVEDAISLLHFHCPSARDAALDRLFAELYRPRDDTLNLAQTQVWWCVAGTYTIGDAVAGRSIAEFARTHMQLATNLTGGRAEGQGRRVDLCCAVMRPVGEEEEEEGGGDPDRKNYRCFGVPVEAGYPFGGDVSRQTTFAVNLVSRYMHPSVWWIVVEAFKALEALEVGKWPAELVGERDRLVVLGTLERTEWFRERIRELAEGPEYRRVVEWYQCQATAWRAGEAARRAGELARRESEVDGTIGTLNMLNGIMERILRPDWDTREAIVEFGDV